MQTRITTDPTLKPLLTLAGAALLLVTMSAQGQSPQEKIAALKQSLAANQAALRQYSWIETTVISMKGEVKKQEQKQCSYGADGKGPEEAPRRPSGRRPTRRLVVAGGAAAG